MEMKKDSLIEMKVQPKNSNPAKNEVIEGSNDNVLQVYLREISSYPQLSFEEEKKLAQLIEQGDIEAKQNFIRQGGLNRLCLRRFLSSLTV